MDPIDEAVSVADCQIIGSLDVEVRAIERKRDEPVGRTFPYPRLSSMYKELEEEEVHRHE